MKRNLKNLLAGTALAIGAVLATGAAAQNYPSKPGRFVVATQAGSASDVLARMLTDHLTKNLGQPWVVDNRGGGSGNIGLSVAAKGAPDGYTLVFGSLGGTIINPFIFSNLDFDAVKDFDPVAFFAGIPFVIAVNLDFPVKNLGDLIGMAKAKPGTVNVALDSSSVKVVHALLEATAGVKTFGVSYNGPALATADTMGGRVPVIIETVGALRQLIDGGKLRAIAITTQASTPLLPGVPSVSEQGVPSFGEVSGWVGVMSPRGTPRNVVTLLNAEINKFLNLPETRQRFLTMGFLMRPGSVDDFTRFIESERARFGPLIKAAGIKAE